MELFTKLVIYLEQFGSCLQLPETVTEASLTLPVLFFLPVWYSSCLV